MKPRVYIETDSVVAEVRTAREAYAARFGFDLEAIGRDLQERERAGGWVILLPPATGEGTAMSSNQAPQSTPAPEQADVEERGSQTLGHLTRYPTGEGRDALAARLGLTIDPYSQDWEYEVANPKKFRDWLTLYRSGRLSDDERFSLMMMLVQCVESLASDCGIDAQIGDLPEWQAVDELLRTNARLHASTIEYWALLEADDNPDHQFWITGPMRRVWAAVQPLLR